MQKLRLITVGLGALALLGAAAADFDGPAPLAWRFLQPTKIAPGGSTLASGNFLYQSIGGRVYCIDRETGNKVWQYPQLDPIDGAFRTTPLSAGGSLLATGDNSIVYAVDPETGAAKWSQRLPSPPLGSPVIVGDAYVTAMSDNSIIALKVSDGTPLWSTVASGNTSSDASVFKVFDGLTGRIASSGPDVLYFSGRNELVALNVVRRAQDWHQAFDQLPPNPQATVTKESIYLNSGPYLITLNPSTGNPRWQIDTGMQLMDAPVASTTGVMVMSTDGHVQIFDQLSRKPVMKTPMDLGSVPIAQGTAVGNDYVIPTSNGAINLIDPTKAEPIWVYIIKPLVETVNTSAGPGGKGGGPPGLGGVGGGGGGGFGGGGGGGFGGGGQTGPGGAGGTQNKPQKITFVQAAAPAILDGDTLILPARDGSVLAFDKTLGIDLTPPAVDMLYPNAGDQVSGQPPLFLLFKVLDDDSGLKKDTIKVEINGQALDFTLDSQDQIVVRFSLSGKNRPLADGRKDIVVTAADWMGNVIHKNFSLTIDNALRPIVLPGQDKNNPNGPGGGKGPGGGFGGGGG